ncbi:MAG: hypothetical protein ETSY1_17585 [Candidatus Entotheonella factor]|uniref:HTH cro/C1-type domain-containing protein n=1 Tax=Entotheonella factor TaxID=1429438 RepID=W4LMW9_ENTF1|nr:MAG: hypothetical protein ETSY1_17585 [Candidatus Entotheonella factor]
MQKTIHSEQGQLIRDKLREVREKAGLTQRELCRKLGREHTFISKCELGERRVDIAEFYWICQACGASPAKEAIRLMKAFAALEKE